MDQRLTKRCQITRDRKTSQVPLEYAIWTKQIFHNKICSLTIIFSPADPCGKENECQLSLTEREEESIDEGNSECIGQCLALVSLDGE